MNESVKFIFKTLLKVPVFILVAYAIFNLFAFSFSYFKIMGFSYVAMQTAVENNYFPQTEYNTLTAYLNGLETAMLENATLTIDTGNGGNERVQYGSEITVTVSAHYRFIWPLMPNEQRSTGVAASGMNDQNIGNALTDDQLKQIRHDRENNPQNNIWISYTVPGLKYYPDLM